MDDNQSGPSAIKRRKIFIRNPKKVTDAEMEAILNASSSSSENEFQPSDDNLSSTDDGLDDYNDDDNNRQSSPIPDSDNQNDLVTGGDSEIATGNDFNADSWQDEPSGMKAFPFFKQSGLLVAAPDSQKPIDYFRLILDDQFLELVLNETNYNAEQIFLVVGGTENSRIARWKPLSKPELLVFFGLLFHTGTIRCSQIQDYWKTDSLFNFKCFSDKMSRDRFLVILRCLHFSHNATDDIPVDRLTKIRPVINYFNEKMLELYYPGKQLSLDESMVLWRGRLQFRQYIKNKRHKYGIKLYMLTEPDGLILNVAVYTGALDAIGGKGHASKVVLALTEGKLDCGHSLYLDNFYNSCQLAEALLKRSTYCTGTLQGNRKGNPKEVISSKISKGQTKAQYCDGIMVGKWKDKRDVLYISTEFENDIMEHTNRRGLKKLKPLPILQYNRYMSGIDRQDQMMSYYPCSRKTVRWYKKLAIHFLQLMLVNSHHLYNMYSGKRLSLYDFRLEVIRELLQYDKSSKKLPSNMKPVEHLPTKITITSEKGETKRKRCRICSLKKIRKNTIYECANCPDKPGLCLGNCFQQFHTNKE